MTDDATPREVGSHAGLGRVPERAVFDRWLRDTGHCEDQHDDMLMPLQRSMNNLMWSAWQAAVAAERERCARICDTTPPYPFRPSIEAAHAIRNQKA